MHIYAPSIQEVMHRIVKNKNGHLEVWLCNVYFFACLHKTSQIDKY